jgi:hypothetical protein
MKGFAVILDTGPLVAWLCRSDRWHTAGGILPVAYCRWHTAGGILPVAYCRWHTVGQPIPWIVGFCGSVTRRSFR